MKGLAAVQQCHNHARVDQNRLHRPKSCRCRLFEPRSAVPEQNFPSPITRCFFFPKRLASRIRNPSLTTLEGVQPSSRTIVFSRLSDRSSSLACTTLRMRSEEHTSELQSRLHLVCRLLLEKKKKHYSQHTINSEAS